MKTYLFLAFLLLLPAVSAATTYNETFSTGINGWVGDCQYNSTTQTLYSTTNWGTCTSPALNFSSTTSFILDYNSYHTTNSTTYKEFMVEAEGTTDNDHVLMDVVTGLMRWRNEPGYDQSCANFPYNQWVQHKRTYNKTSSTTATLTFNITNATSTCGWTKSITVNWSNYHDYLRIATGDLNNGYLQIDNITLTVLDNETPSNYTPLFSFLNFTPANIADIQDATGYMNATDPDSVNVSYYCTWKVNGATISTPELINRTAGVTQQTSTLSETNYAISDVLLLTCTATDGVHNTTASYNQTVRSAAGAGGESTTTSTVVGGGSSTTIIIQQEAAAALAFGKPTITKFTILNDYNEQPRQLSTTILLNKAVKACQTTGNITCKVSANNTQILITSTITEYNFLTKSITGSVTAISNNDETTTSNIEFKLFNLAAGIGPTTSSQPPEFFKNFPYLLRVNPQGQFGGVRLVPAVLLFIIIIILVRRELRKSR